MIIKTKDLIKFIKGIVNYDDVVPGFKKMHKEYIREIIKRLKEHEEWKEVASE